MIIVDLKKTSHDTWTLYSPSGSIIFARRFTSKDEAIRWTREYISTWDWNLRVE